MDSKKEMYFASGQEYGAVPDISLKQENKRDRRIQEHKVITYLSMQALLSELETLYTLTGDSGYLNMQEFVSANMVYVRPDNYTELPYSFK